MDPAHTNRPAVPSADELTLMKVNASHAAWKTVEQTFDGLLKNHPESHEKLLNFTNKLIEACKAGESNLTPAKTNDILRFFAKAVHNLDASDPLGVYTSEIYSMVRTNARYSASGLSQRNTGTEGSENQKNTATKTLEGLQALKNFFVIYFDEKREHFDKKTVDGCDATIDRLYRAMEECGKILQPSHKATRK